MAHGGGGQGPSANEIAELPVAALLRRFLDDPGAEWSMGAFGALAEFRYAPGESCEIESGEDLALVTARGALRLELPDGLELCAYERPIGNRGDWSHGVALCLPERQAVMHRRDRVTALGPDEAALRATDRAAELFDLGLGCEQTDVCVRSADPAVLARLGWSVGRSLLAGDNPLMSEMPALSPHRVFLSRLGRLEVYQPIPPADGTSPEGPHTHVLPGLLKHRRSHDANTPIPAGLTPCATLHPAHPCRDQLGRAVAFDPEAHERFQALLRRFGRADLVVAKAQVMASVRDGRPPAGDLASRGRAVRAAVRVALRQLEKTDGPSPALARWQRLFDPNLRPSLDPHLATAAG